MIRRILRRLFRVKPPAGPGVSAESGCEFLGRDSMYFAPGVTIGKGGFFTAEGGSLSVGRNTAFNANCHINAAVGGNLTIGENCLIGPNVVMRTADHNFDRLDIPIREQGHKIADIVIEDDVWIGANVVVLGGVRIGRGAVVGAGAVVARSIPPLAVALGVPARVVRMRDGSAV